MTVFVCSTAFTPTCISIDIMQHIVNRKLSYCYDTDLTVVMTWSIHHSTISVSSLQLFQLYVYHHLEEKTQIALDCEQTPLAHQKCLSLSCIFVSLRSNSRQTSECGSAKLMHKGIFWPISYWWAGFIQYLTQNWTENSAEVMLCRDTGSMYFIIHSSLQTMTSLVWLIYSDFSRSSTTKSVLCMKACLKKTPKP